jgi:tricorn protease
MAVLFQSRDADDKTIYSLPLNGGQISQFASFRGIPAGRGDDGETHWRIDRVPSILSHADLTNFKFSISVKQNHSTRLRLGFRKIWRTLSERFYDESMNATDWDAVLEKYEDAAASAMESRQFDRIVAQLLGELNSSHLTFKTKPWGLKSKDVKVKKRTAHPGLVFKDAWSGPLVIEKVVTDSPIAGVKSAPGAGETVIRIGGKNVDAKTPLGKFFNGAGGRPLPLVVADKAGKIRTLELIPVSYNKIRWLDKQAKDAQAQRAVEAEGFVYLPFRKMKTADLREIAVEVYRSSINARGLVLDLRDNAGGRVADELLAMFCQPVHTFTVPRGGERGYPTDRRVSPSWDGPMVVLCNENTFSNAEIFCHAFKQLKRGKLVGMPTNGGVISAVDISIPEIGELQIPFRGWFHAETGSDLELNGAVPDVIVPMMPEDQATGRDPQLAAAIKTLLSEVQASPPVLEPRLKSEDK